MSTKELPARITATPCWMLTTPSLRELLFIENSNIYWGVTLYWPRLWPFCTVNAFEKWQWSWFLTRCTHTHTQRHWIVHHLFFLIDLAFHSSHQKSTSFFLNILFNDQSEFQHLHTTWWPELMKPPGTPPETGTAGAIDWRFHRPLLRSDLLICAGHFFVCCWNTRLCKSKIMELLLACAAFMAMCVTGRGPAIPAVCFSATNILSFSSEVIWKKYLHVDPLDSCITFYCFSFFWGFQ